MGVDRGEGTQTSAFVSSVLWLDHIASGDNLGNPPNLELCCCCCTNMNQFEDRALLGRCSPSTRICLEALLLPLCCRRLLPFESKQ